MADRARGMRPKPRPPSGTSTGARPDGRDRPRTDRLGGDRPAGREGDPVIRARGLTRHYGDLVAVDHLDLDVWSGEIFGLLGPNGAGKTTTILMLLGLSEPTFGEVRVLGLDPARYPLEVKRQVGYLPDNAGFYGGLTGRENLRYTARLNGLAGPEEERRLDDLLTQVGLEDAADRRVETYSRGMRQRLGVADALVKDPRILILDEPTVAIDPVGVAEMLALMRRLVAERHISLLLASHLLDQVQSVCDRVGIFSSGQLIGLGTVPALARQFGDGSAEIEVGVDLEDRDTASVRDLVRGINGVTTVIPHAETPGLWSVRVEPADGEGPIRAAIARAVLEEGIQLTSIRPVAPSLDEIYRKAVERGVAVRPRRVRERPRAGTGAVV